MVSPSTTSLTCKPRKAFATQLMLIQKSENPDRGKHLGGNHHDQTAVGSLGTRLRHQIFCRLACRRAAARRHDGAKQDRENQETRHVRLGPTAQRALPRRERACKRAVPGTGIQSYQK